MSDRRAFLIAFSVVSLLLGNSQLASADVYYVQPIAELEILEGALPNFNETTRLNYRVWWRAQVVHPYAVLDGDGEIYISPRRSPWERRWRARQGEAPDTTSVAIRVPEARAITGKIYFPLPDYSGMQSLRFSIPSDQGQENERSRFLRTKLQHYENLMSQERPGTAWYRHQVRKTRTELGIPTDTTDELRNRFRQRDHSMAETYALVSGGRAVSENLQLDRLLPQTATEPPTVELDSIRGVTVQAFDWSAMIKDADPSRDPLATLIPNDQYALFMPTFPALVALADHAGEQGEVVLRAAEPRAEDAGVRRRYERQLGLELNTLARNLGPALIKSVAVTGADPYLRTGADIAILFEAHDANTLQALIKTQFAVTVGTQTAAEAIAGTIDGVSYTGFRSPDRSICSYLAVVDDTVVVTNSPAQLERLIRVSQGELPSLDTLKEYTFFRERYPAGDTNETGFLILSDDTIRKWCGPRWRIATSRRTRAAALMAEMQARHLDLLVEGRIDQGPLHTDFTLPDAGEFSLGPGGVRSSVYGTLEFLTPILELEFEKVSKTEADFYQRWRQGYERNWSNFFDPIAIQFKASPSRLGIDLTVMPLIEFSDYRQLVNISQGAVIGEHSGDPHAESLVHGVLALNTDSELLSRGANMASTVANVNPLSWIGQSVALYVDNDPLWIECAQLEDEQEIEDFLEANAYRLPIAANIEVRNSLKLITFLAGIRTFIEQSAPGMTVWETLNYKEQPYVKVSSSERARSGNAWDKVSVHYVASGKNLIVSISEDVLKRAIDRQVARSQQLAAGEPVTRTGPTWLGKNLCVTVDGRLLELLHKGFGTTYHRQMQRLAWSNLAILNEWHARYANRDAVDVHQTFWQRKLICPGGGQYRWNENWQTMESTVYGHPGEPRLGTALPAALQSVTSGNFGQTFEEHGLRARVQLDRNAAPEVPLARRHSP